MKSDVRRRPEHAQSMAAALSTYLPLGTSGIDHEPWPPPRSRVQHLLYSKQTLFGPVLNARATLSHYCSTSDDRLYSRMSPIIRQEAQLQP